MRLNYIGPDISPRHPADPLNKSLHGFHGFLERFRIKGKNFRDSVKSAFFYVIVAKQGYSMIHQGIPGHKEHFKKIVQMIKSGLGNVIHQKAFKISAYISFKKRINRKSQPGAVDIVVTCIYMSADKY